jgi:hypothetical protein
MFDIASNLVSQKKNPLPSKPYNKTLVETLWLLFDYHVLAAYILPVASV